MTTLKQLLPLAAAIQMIAVGDGAGGDGGDGGAGGAGGQQSFKDTEEFKQAVQAAVAAETSGLRANRDDILGQLNQHKQTLKQYSDVDPDLYKQLVARFESQEEQELFKAGKFDELVDRRVDKMKAKFDTDLRTKDQELEKAIARQRSLESRAIAAEITKAATEAGALPSAITDFIQRSQGSFMLNEKGDVIAVDKDGNPIFDTDGKTPLSAKSWALSLQAEAPHLFSKPNSGGSQGSQGGHQSGKINGTAAEREAYFKSKYNLP